MPCQSTFRNSLLVYLDRPELCGQALDTEFWYLPVISCLFSLIAIYLNGELPYDMVEVIPWF